MILIGVGNQSKGPSIYSSIDNSPLQKIPKLKIGERTDYKKRPIRRQLSLEDKLTRSLMVTDERKKSRVPLRLNQDIYIPG